MNSASENIPHEFRWRVRWLRYGQWPSTDRDQAGRLRKCKVFLDLCYVEVELQDFVGQMRSPNENVEFISEPHIKHEPPESFDGHSIESGILTL